MTTKTTWLVLIGMLAACGPAASTTDAGSTDDTSITTDAATPVDRGPRVVAIDGDPNGLWWDAASATLFVADDDNNRILRWTDAAGFSLVADLPPTGPSGAGLGQLVRTSDGTIAVTRFGFGTAGDIAYVSPDGTAHVVPSLDVMRRRIGLTVTQDGRLFDSYFVRTSGSTPGGAVATLDLAGTEPDAITGLMKPVGVLATHDALFISDQMLGQILRAELTSPSTFTVFATLDGPDLLCEGPNGSLFTGGDTGVVTQIDAAGMPSVFTSGLLSARGVAYDALNRRLFVAEHDAMGVANTVRIFPVD